jgi:hypothetical protein
MRSSSVLFSFLFLGVACSESGEPSSSTTGGTNSGGAASGGSVATGGNMTTGGSTMTGGSVGESGGATGGTQVEGSGGNAAGGAEGSGASGGQSAGTGAQTGAGGEGENQTGGATGAGGSPAISCVGDAWLPRFRSIDCALRLSAPPAGTGRAGPCFGSPWSPQQSMVFLLSVRSLTLRKMVATGP